MHANHGLNGSPEGFVSGATSQLLLDVLNAMGWRNLPLSSVIARMLASRAPQANWPHVFDSSLAQEPSESEKTDSCAAES